jgi:hypothetical protein
MLVLNLCQKHYSTKLSVTDKRTYECFDGCPRRFDFGGAEPKYFDNCDFERRESMDSSFD